MKRKGEFQWEKLLKKYKYEYLKKELKKYCEEKQADSC